MFYQNDGHARVLLVSHTYVVGMNRRKVEELANEREISMRLLVPSRWKDTLRQGAAEESNNEAVEVVLCATAFAGHPLRHSYDIAAVWRLLSRYRPDLVHVEEEPGSLALLQFALLSRLLRFKVTFFTWENIYRNSLLMPIEGLNLRLANGAIAGNEEAATVLRQKGFRRKIAIVPQLGVDVAEDVDCTASASRKRFGLNGFVAGYAGRLVEEKGLFTLVEAVGKLPGDWRLLLVGKGPARPRIESRAREMGILNRVVFVEGVRHEEVTKYIRAMDVLVLPSLTGTRWKEQFGHVLIEAMAEGVPVIGSSSGAIPEVIGDAGLVFSEGSVDGLRGALSTLASSEAVRAEYGRRGRERVLAHFTNRRIAERTGEFFREVLSASR